MLTPPCVLCSVTDNDSLAANLAAKLKADLLILMTDVDGIYSAPPSEGGRLLDRFFPSAASAEAPGIVFGTGSKVGRGGMEAKVQSASWAWRKGTAVVVANGNRVKYDFSCVCSASPFLSYKSALQVRGCFFLPPCQIKVRKIIFLSSISPWFLPNYLFLSNIFLPLPLLLL